MPEIIDKVSYIAGLEAAKEICEQNSNEAHRRSAITRIDTLRDIWNTRAGMATACVEDIKAKIEEAKHGKV